MLFGLNKVKLDLNSEVMILEYLGIKYYCYGVFFLEGYKAGYDSLKKLAEEYSKNGQLDFVNYYGAYSIVIVEGDRIIFFSDNSHLNCLYYNNDNVSSDIYSIIKESHARVSFNDYSIFQYLNYDCVYSEETIVDGIKSTLSEFYYILDSSGINKRMKEIGDLNSKELGISPEKFSEIMNYSLSDLNKNISLTGGFDSRYVLSMLIDSKNISSGISTANLSHKDVLISKKVAKTAGIKNHKIVCVDEPIINQNLIIDMWKSRHCSIFSIAEYIYRLNVYLRILKDAGIDCLITGDTGIFHKSEDWYQEIPFYSKKKCNKKSFYNKRVIDIKAKLPLSFKMKKYDKIFQEEMMRVLENNEQKICTKSIDWYNWYVIRGSFYRTIYTNQSYLLKSYAPMMEYRFVINSYNLPRKERIFGKYMKKYITKTNRELAHIKTATNVTTSIEKKYFLVDLFFNFLNLAKAALRLFGKKFFRKVWFSESVMNWDFSDSIRKLNLASEALFFAKEKKWVDVSTDVNTVNYKLLCKLIELYLIQEYI